MQQTKNGYGAARVEGSTVDAVCEEVARRADPAERELAARFTRLLYAKAPPEFIQDRSPETLSRLTLGTFRHLQRSRHDHVDVEVVNPDLETHGWYAPVTVIRTNVSERPFIVDTLREHLHSLDIEIERFVYPVLRVVRGDDGTVDELAPASDGEPRESLIYCEVARINDPDKLERIRGGIQRHLEDVVRATDDFEAMVEALNETVAYLDDRARTLPDRADEIAEAQELLRWLRDGGFVFLGYRGYDISDRANGGRAAQVEPESGLGILHEEADSSFAQPVPLEELRPELRERMEDGPLLITSKTNAQSTVHRRTRMDYIGVKKLNDEGRVTGERRFIGLFTSQAYSEDAENIPILREKLRAILEDAHVMPETHDYKEIITIFNSMPKEELFLTSAEEIGAEIHAVLAHYHTHDIKVMLRPDPLERGISVTTILPKEKFSGDVRRAIESAYVERFDGALLNYHLALGGGDQARLHFYISAAPERLEAVEASDLEDLVRRIIRSWADRVREGLEDMRPGDEARRLVQRYGAAFSAEYMAATEPEVAEQDILELEAMAVDDRNVSISLSNLEPDEGVAVDEPITNLKVYLRNEHLVLSDFMPILENAGLRVIAMHPFEVIGADVPDATIYVFAVQDSAGEPIDLARRGELLSEAILEARAGGAANDPLNALVLGAGLAWREVDVLRAYAEYAFQIGAVPSRLSLVTALRSYPSAARLLFELFAAKFDPGAEPDADARAEAMASLRKEFLRSLERVKSLADDRALRRLLMLIDATVRTNYYRHGGPAPTKRSGGVPYISMKFACDALEGVTRDRLLYEVWVHSARMAGVHLRGARVARGGIRYSDRPDDFRAEVLGLVKTQTVKNAVIVPGGSKGGFIAKRQLADRAAMAREVEEQYRTLIRGLLDLTDNLDDGEIVAPDGVITYDAPDPYLVVAADKGTAHLSDRANATATEYGFWMGDAFASGGSHGYDHKTIGITARGAWECVKRHFREQETDIQTEPFTAVGIGDMSGDVFGNGMLLSPQTRLVAAFDHRHIFIDPDPDPEASYAERKRLFEAGRTTWDDYDRDALGEHGFIAPRDVKEVELSDVVREALGLPDDVRRLDGESLIRAVLAAPVDLLWNGGIGTYVKASGERHGDVGDSANDAVRIDADELRARAVGEGGNLGLTQQARIEYALRGGRLNTDALDNSGGVDLSDREVNLKILLNGAIADGELSFDARNDLLEELTEPVTHLVLRDNQSQSLAISLDEIRARESVDEFCDLMLRLEREGLLERSAEGLPSTETLDDRRSQGKSLTRPELSVLLAYSKLDLKRKLLASELPGDPAARDYLAQYFPAEAVEAGGRDALESHRLRREIITSQLTNELVDLMGAGFVNRMVRDTGHPAAEVARAWLIAARLSGARALRETLAELESELSTRVVYRWLFGLGRALERTTRWVLGNVAVDAPAATVIEAHLDGLGRLRGHFGEIVAGQEREVFEDRVRELNQLTPDTELAQRLITLRFLDQLLEILRVARDTEARPLRAGRAYYLASELVGLPWLREALFAAAGDDRWDQRAAQALAEDLGRAHRSLTALVVGQNSASESVDDLLERVRENREGELARFRSLLDEVRAGGRPSLSALSIAVRELEGVTTAA